MDRKTFFKKGFSNLIGKIVKETSEVIEDISLEIKKSAEPLQETAEELMRFPEVTKANNVPRKLKPPPGALKDKKLFKQKCTGCGDCIYRCAYSVLFPVFDKRANKSLPYMDVNTNPCLMCKDWPCIDACNEGALVHYKENEAPKFGRVKSLFEHCKNEENGYALCTDCQDACPIDLVISFKKGRPSFARDCTGCGLCVQACYTYPKALVVP